jgi:hypothetical protein
MRHTSLRALLAILLLAILACGVILPADAAELPPPLVAKFTRHVQPLLLNKCAAGACHGGPAAAAPRLQRGFGGGSLDRTTTLANLESFLAAVGPERDPRQLVAALAVRHPATAAKGAIVAAPLSARERLTLEQWLAAVRVVEPPRRFDPAVTPVATTVAEPSAAKPNRFRELLDTAANPPQLPPPQQPQGVIFKPDTGE